MFQFTFQINIRSTTYEENPHEFHPQSRLNVNVIIVLSRSSNLRHVRRQRTDKFNYINAILPATRHAIHKSIA